MLADARARWNALPPRARWVLALYLVGFADGTGSHVLRTTQGGIHAYATFPPVPVQVFLVGLFVCVTAPALLRLMRLAGIEQRRSIIDITGITD